jgi:hypothetical protein
MNAEAIQKLASELPGIMMKMGTQITDPYDPACDYYDELYRASSILVYLPEPPERPPTKHEFIEILRLAHPILAEAVRDRRQLAERLYDVHFSLVESQDEECL